MVMTDAEAVEATTETWKATGTERVRLRRFVRYGRGQQKLPWLPDNVESEYRDIALKSASNWLDLVVRSTAQGLHVDSYGTTDGPSPLWDLAWQANGMDARQHALHKAVLTLGYSGLIVFPSDDGGVWMRPESATKLSFAYDDPSDEFPRMVVREVGKDRFELYTDEARYSVSGKGVGAKVVIAEHDAGVCPVVEMRSSLDLLGTPMGEVEPVIPIQDRIVDATFTLQMVAKYGAFPQRWIAGIDTTKPLLDANGEVLTDGQGNPLFPTIKAYVDHILTAVDADTKFGQFAAADLGQYVAALEAHIRHLAAITQTPPHYLLGSLVNLSAEALAAAESGLQRKIKEKREVLGEGYEQAFRVAGALLGMEDEAEAVSSQVHWQDVESRSLAQTSDALLKLSQLGVPLQVLLKMIPGFTQQDVDEAIDVIERGGGLNQLLGQLAGAQEPNTANTDAAAVKAQADALGVLVRAGVDPDEAATRVGLDGVEFTGAVPTSLRLPQTDATVLEGA